MLSDVIAAKDNLAIGTNVMVTLVQVFVFEALAGIHPPPCFILFQEIAETLCLRGITMSSGATR